MYSNTVCIVFMNYSYFTETFGSQNYNFSATYNICTIIYFVIQINYDLVELFM
jgi:hypothetical protein